MKSDQNYNGSSRIIFLYGKTAGVHVGHGVVGKKAIGFYNIRFEIVRMFFRQLIFHHSEERCISKIYIKIRSIICIKNDTMSKWKVPMTGWQPPELMKSVNLKYIGKEVAQMTAFEIISVFIGVLALLMSFGSLLIALLDFLDKEKISSKKNKRK